MDDLSSRKRDHLRLVADGTAAMRGVTTGLERWRPSLDPLPELALADVTTSTSFLGRELGFPFMIAAMSGGPAEGGLLNRRLARVAAAAGVGLELGSLRPALAGDPAVLATYDVRALFPSGLLLGNIGATALRDPAVPARLAELVARLGLDGLSVHLNPLHEAVQPSGDTDFTGVSAAVRALAERLPVPVGLKTVGSGVAPRALPRLAALPVAWLSIQGAGGTSFGRVEAARLADPVRARAARELQDLGTPLAEGLVAAADFPRPVLAGGGVRGGVDLFTCLALGASLASAAAPLLVAALASEDEALGLLQSWREAFRLTLFATGVRDVATLRTRGRDVLEAVS
jgi:isopentenyl-diphosphate delta-isomerase